MYNCMRPKGRTFFMLTHNVLCVRVYLVSVIVNGHYREKCSADLPFFFPLEGFLFQTCHNSPHK